MSHLSTVLLSFAKSSKETMQAPLPLCLLLVPGGRTQSGKVRLQPQNPSAAKDKLASAMQKEKGQD